MKTILFILVCSLPSLCFAQSGIITTIAGNGTDGVGGDNGPAASAQVSNAVGMCFDKKGNLGMYF